MNYKKSYFTKLKRVMEKTNDGLIGIQRIGNFVYVTNGIIIVRMEYTYFKLYMDRNIFPDINDGDSISRRSKSNYKDWGPGFNMENMFSVAENKMVPAKLTKLSLDLSNNEAARLLVCNRELIAINEIYYNAAKPFFNNLYIYGIGRCHPVMFYSHDYKDNPLFSFLILPVNLRDYDGMTLSYFLAA